MDLKCGYFTFLVTGLIVLVKYTTAEFYSSIVGMESLLETEEAVIKNLNSYILEQKSRLIEFEKTLQRYNDEHNKAKEDFQRFLGIPLNSFLLTKRLTADLEDLIKKVEIDIDFLKNINQTKEQYTFPSKHDLMGAALAITRLQDSYDLKTVDLVNGVINGIDYGIKLTISDCLTISKEMIRTEYYYFAEQWLLESLKMVESEENINTSPIPILENLAKLAHMKNNLTLARDYTEKILQLDSNNKNGLELLEVITEITSSVDYTEVPETPFERTDEDPKYSPACKGELVKSPQELSKLKCYYSSVDSYFLKIAPIKVEQANINPPIVVFHDIVSDKEIELIQKLAIPKFERAGLIKPKDDDNASDHSESRVCKVGWLTDKEHPVLTRLFQRMADFTGLSMEPCEALQVGNYGIGGHYSLHTDYFKDNDINFSDYGNRISTLLIYV